MKQIQILGTGCPKCKKLTELTMEAASRLFGGSLLEVVALMFGSWVSARMSGQAKLLAKPPDEILFALLGGVMIGIGAALAGGCVVGNIMSGWALMSVGMFLFGIVTILSNWAATYIYIYDGRTKRTIVSCD